MRWYCRYQLSYRDVEGMVHERSLDVEHSTVFRGVQRYAPEINKRIRQHSKMGYAGYLKAPGGTERSFEMALFKSRNAPPLIVVSNELSDMQYSSYDTFFLRRVGKEWIEVRDEVLPPLDPRMFWDDPRAAGRLSKIVTLTPKSDYHFEPPRRGTQMKVTLEICDHFDEAPPEATLKEFNKLKETVRPIRWEWDSKSGRYKCMKS